MRWSPESVAGFADRAGWKGDDAVTAVAVALAASEGDDHARDLVLPGPQFDGRGVWLLDVVAFPEVIRLDLYHPGLNAIAAYGLWGAEGASWDWHPVYRAGQWRWRLDEACRGVSGLNSTQTLGTQGYPWPALEQIKAAGREAFDLARRLASLAPTRR